MSANPVHYFGIRHHGPGCARSLLRAFDALQPDCVLVEGPPDAEGVLAALLSEHMQPPVALLSYCPDEPQRAVYHPFAVFSPEWQALRWALLKQVPVSFIDLPVMHQMALDKAQEAVEAEEAARQEAEAEKEAEAQQALQAQATPGAETDAPDSAEAIETSSAIDNAAETADEAGIALLPDAHKPQDPPAYRTDPLNWLAQAAGHADGESWWNHTVEERGDGEELFVAIAEAMTALRADLGEQAQERDPDDARRELLREAHMRQRIRDAIKKGHERIAVVCGAWHLGGLQAATKASADAALLKGLPKLKVQSTWVPWTYRHLTSASGYGAGIEAPGWYEHLWLCGQQADTAASAAAALAAAPDDAGNASAARPARPPAAPPSLRTIGWLARIARLMRERDLDCSSAHLIETARLADTLAALRQRPQPGLEELHEATRTVLTLGDESVLHFIKDALLVGQKMGQVPPDVPTVPLQKDLEQQQKSLRLKAEAFERTLDLDLRQPNDLARSHLLHRLNLIGIPWGRLSRTGGSARGTFHEIWSLQWQPEFIMKLIEASPWGHSLEAAATARSLDRAHKAANLGELSALVNQALLADLGEAVQAISRILENRAAVSGDTLQLLDALPPLANVFRYGNVRQTDTALVAHMLDSLILRAAIALPLACAALNDEAAQTLREKIIAAHGAIALRDADEQTQAWQRALRQVAASGQTHELLQGLAGRLLLDEHLWEPADAAQALSLHLSSGAEPLKAAAWLEGFLNRNALVLLHDAALWQLVNDWLCGLGEEHFIHILPLVRRTFSAFSASERSDLGQRARQGARPVQAVASAPGWDEELAALPLPLLRAILGVAV
jgi:chemotaxis protein histidine kinase CheA